MGIDRQDGACAVQDSARSLEFLVMNLDLITDRLRLTPLSWVDLDLALEMFTDPEVVKYVCDLMNEEMVRAEMSNSVRRGGDGWIGIWCVSDRETGEKLGSSFLLPMPVEEDDTDYSLVVPGKVPDGDIEIGYCFKRSAWGKGYATEAIELVTDYAFKKLNLHKLTAGCYQLNEAAIKAFQRKTDRPLIWL